MTKVYIQKWNKADVPWQCILADILKRDYYMEEIPEILRNEMGKPYFANGAMHFNVSHSEEYLAIAISKKPVGVDIQGPKNIREGMYKKVIQPAETVLIGENREQDFLRLWTLKESFVKAEGKGLRIPMKDYYFEREKGRYFVNYGGQRMSWTFNIEETLVEGYFVSVCGMEDQVQWILNQE